MMEDWNDGMMESKRLDSCLYPPFLTSSNSQARFQFSIIPLIQIKQTD